MSKYDLGLSVDLSDLKNYMKAVVAVKKGWKSFVEGYLEELGMRALEKIIPRTPVNKDPDADSPGLLRRSWRLSEVQEKGKELSIYLINDAKKDGQDESYAGYVEFGHLTRNRTSWVEGVFMLTVSLEELQLELQNIFDRKVLEYMRGKGMM